MKEVPIEILKHHLKYAEHKKENSAFDGRTDLYNEAVEQIEEFTAAISILEKAENNTGS